SRAGIWNCTGACSSATPRARARARAPSRSSFLPCAKRPMFGPAMAKLYFRYGTMESAKSMNLLAVAHNYRKQGKRVVLLKPALDDRFGSERIASRSGLHADADIL